MICFYFRYLESCSIPALKRKCKSSANTSSSSSEDDKLVQQSQQEVEALEGNAQYTDNHNRTATTDLFLMCHCCTFQGLCPLFKLLSCEQHKYFVYVVNICLLCLDLTIKHKLHY